MLLKVVEKGPDTLKTWWAKFHQNLGVGSRDIHEKSAPNEKSAHNEKSAPNEISAPNEKYLAYVFYIFITIKYIDKVLKECLNHCEIREWGLEYHCSST